MGLELAQETVWFDKWRYDDAEAQFYEQKCGLDSSKSQSLLDCAAEAPLVDTAPQKIDRPAVTSERPVVTTDKPVATSDKPVATTDKPAVTTDRPIIAAEGDQGGRVPPTAASSDIINRVTKLEGEKDALKKTVKSLESTVAALEKRLAALEGGSKAPAPAQSKPAPPPAQDDDDDDDVDLFGSDDEEEDAEAQRVREERLKQYAEKKSKKAGPIAKSSVLLDCKPWDDETDMKAMETKIRTIQMDGLTWGAAKLNPLAFGIMKLSILCTVEDEKVSIDDLTEKIEEFEDFVQSVDIAAFNKI